MKARVTVSPKKTVLDPQGQAIGSALKGRGYAAVQDVRQGKVFEIELASGSDGGALPQQALRRQMEEIARDILSNPVIEDYRVEILE